MEKNLKDRDRVGVQDFILLEDYQNINAFVDNLRKRFKENLIYTYIGQVLISVNPYKPLPIYSDDIIREYRRAGFLETPPHVYAVTDTAYRSLTEENIGQCILISGESGAGKTEASKSILKFIAVATGNGTQVANVKDKLLNSNPVLEAFGNAKTNKNDNSSRFGKYMDITFNVAGEPAGGNILNYLLEKSRVVHQGSGERNFHIFYQILSGAEQSMLDRLYLDNNPQSYNYLTKGSVSSFDAEHDKKQFTQVYNALSAFEMSADEQQDLFSVVASVLHLGNIGFKDNENSTSILDIKPVAFVAKLLGFETELLTKALTHRTISAREDSVTSPLIIDQAIYARDALAKAIYDRLFTWLVQRLNNSLQAPETVRAVLGILDIYGFEIFDGNGFEQFCINYCNEKLQQLFIKLTLQQEQEEYRREGIEWEQIDFFDNKVICDMIEEKHKGIIAMMDEECLRPGYATDLTLLSKLNKTFGRHPHYINHENSSTKVQKSLGRDEFRLVHYAGDVTYNINGFLDKNSDLLFRDVREVMTKATNRIIKTVFPEKELLSKKRPDTAMNQFRNSLAKLMIILSDKQPSYIRCIRPNDAKTMNVFDDSIVKHQVKYLGLMENLRVRRAGFAYRRPYEEFLRRYKCLSKKTWPNYHGNARDGVKALLKDIHIPESEYRCGFTKLFIRTPTTLFQIEDSFQMKKHDIVTIIQKIWKGRQQRLKYEKMRAAAIQMEKIVRGYLARKRAQHRRRAVATIRRFVQGFITRNGPQTDMNRAFVEVAKRQWLIRLSQKLPKNVLDQRWPKCPLACEEASKLLKEMHRRHLARKYRLRLTPERKKRLEEKILAEQLFKGKKKTYENSFPHWFENNRVTNNELPFELRQHLNGENFIYATPATKYDRHGYKERVRTLLISDQHVYLIETKTGKLKHKLPHKAITELVVTAGADNLLLVRIASDLKKDKGDLILSVPHLIETVIKYIDLVKNENILKIVPSGEIQHNVFKGQQGKIHVSSGAAPELSKTKSGILLVTG